MAADFNAGILTDKGKALLVKWHEGSCVPELTRAAAGAGSYTSGEDLNGRTALKDERMSIGFSHIETQNETTVALRFTLTNEDLKEGFTITEIGVFATDPDEGEILYSITTTADESNADYMPAYNGEYPTTIIFNYQIEVANAASVTIVAGSTGMYALAADLEAAEVKIGNLESATADLEEQIEDAVKELEDEIVVKVEEAQEAADKAQDTADQAVTDAANAQSTADTAKSGLTDGSVTKVGTSTVGSGTNPIYLDSGTPKASTATAGSTSRPVYMSGGKLVETDYVETVEKEASEAKSTADEAKEIAENVKDATIEIGTTTTGDPGTAAKVTNTGEGHNAILNFTIPQGEQGEKGDKGDTGATGATGAAGKDGADGKDGTAYYGTCSTAASTAAKVVTCDGFTLETGATICVCFTNANSASSPTMNVNSTGAKSITSYGTTAASTYTWRAGGVMIFTYDGTSWVINNFSIANTSYYGVTKLSDSTSSTSTSLAATANAVGTAYSLADEANTAAANAQSTADTAKSGLTDGSVTKVGTSTVGGSAKPIYLSSGTPTACSSTVGSGTVPTYLSSGTVTASTSTVGSGTKPVYLSSGTVTASSSTVGSGTQPAYLSSGTITACGTTVGSSTKPIYSNSGVLTACSSTVGSGTKPIYSSSGTLTASSSTVGSSTNPVYLNSGTVTACSMSDMIYTSQLTSSSISISANSSYTNTALSFSVPSGYSVLGISGYNISGDYGTYIIPTRIRWSQSGSCVQLTLRNTGSGTASVTIALDFIYLKTS